MPDATTDGTHGKSTTKVIEDDPWAMFGVTVNLCEESKNTKKAYQGSRV